MSYDLNGIVESVDEMGFKYIFRDVISYLKIKHNLKRSELYIEKFEAGNSSSISHFNDMVDVYKFLVGCDSGSGIKYNTLLSDLKKTLTVDRKKIIFGLEREHIYFNLKDDCDAVISKCQYIEDSLKSIKSVPNN